MVFNYLTIIIYEKKNKTRKRFKTLENEKKIY